MRSSKRTFIAAVAAALAAMPGTASAHTTDVIAESGGSVTILPILGVGLQVEVVLDASGNLDQVNLEPHTGVVATELGPHEVEFKLTGTSTEVTVEAEGDELAIEVETTTLADLLGPGSWTADLFGTGMVTVLYEIGENDGMPAVTIDGVTVPTGVDYSILAETDEDETEIKIDFFHDGFVKTLRIEVEAEGDEAELTISLRGEDVRRLVGSLAELAGTYTWEGALCDGTLVVVTYQLAEDGSLSLVGVTGTDDVVVESDDDGLDVSLAGSDKRIEVEIDQQDDGSWSMVTEVDNECDSDDDDVSEEDDLDDDDVSEEDEFDDGHDASTTNVTVVDDDDESDEDD
jgi:hypothetical protein